MTPSRIALISVVSNTSLLILKLAAGIYTGSLSILSEAVDSATDLLASFIAFFSLRESEKPPDIRHPYGHGKWENIGSVIEATFIFFGALAIIYYGLKRFMGDFRISFVGLGIVVMIISSFTNLILSRYILKAAIHFDSLALKTDAWHLKVNVFQSVLVLFGLVFMKLTGFSLLDPAIAIVLAVFILKMTYDIIKRSFSGLLDERLPQDEEAAIARIINSHNKQYGNLVGFHNLRTRKSGRERHIDLHLVVNREERIKNAHEMCDHLERDIKKVLPNSDIVIHVEPYESK